MWRELSRAIASLGRIRLRIPSVRWIASPFFIVAAALTLRMGLLFLSWTSAPPSMSITTGEPYGYESGHIAAAIASGKGFSSPLPVASGPTAWLGPIYPYVISAIFRALGVYSMHSLHAIQALNCALSSLIVFPVYGIARRSFDATTAVFSSWLWVFLPTAWHIPIANVWDSTLSALFLALIFHATVVLRGRRKLLHWAGYGALWAAAALVNPALLSLFPLFLLWLAQEARKQEIPCLRMILATLLMFLAGMIPWSIRNYRVLGEFVPVRSNFGLELWLGNNLDSQDVNSFSQHPFVNAAEASEFVRLGEVEYMAQKKGEAVAFIRSHPRETLVRVAARFFTHWFSVSDRPGSSGAKMPLHLKLFFPFNAIIVLSGWLGAGIVYRKCGSLAQPYLAVLFVYPLVFYITHTTLRYRHPMEPILAILAVVGGLSVLDSISTKTSRLLRPTLHLIRC